MSSLVDYKGLSTLNAEVGPGGSATNADLSALADRIGPCNYTATTDPTSDDNESTGLSRQTFARDSVSSTNADVTINYDSLGRTLEEAQVYVGNTGYVTNDAFTSTPATEVTYPNARKVNCGYDLLYRKNAIHETSGGASIAAWQYFGQSRVAEIVLGNGLIQTMMNNARTNSAVQIGVPNPAWGNISSNRLGYDGAGRMITKRYLAGGINGTTHAYNNTTSVAGFTTYYDYAGNKLYERQLQAENRSALYEPFTNFVPQGGYDSANRLLQYQRGTLDSTGGLGNLGGGDITSAITLTGTNKSQTYDLDGLGNWKNTTYLPVGGSATTELRRHNYLNELTKFGSTPVTYDHGNNAASPDPLVQQRGNGNIVNDGSRIYAYDAFNRLLTVKKTPDSDLIATYVYDALGRRIRKVVTFGGIGGGVPNGTTDYLYLGWQCLEERDGSNNPLRQYIWGLYIDELIQLTALQSVGTQPIAAGTYYPLQDLLYRTQCLTDSTGAIVEVYDTDAYGNTLIFASYASTTPLAAPACEQIFTGQRYDPETENYYYKARYLQTYFGRFISRDPIEYIVGPNLYSYVESSPNKVTDPSGETPSPGWVIGRGYPCSKHDDGALWYVDGYYCPNPPPGSPWVNNPTLEQQCLNNANKQPSKLCSDCWDDYNNTMKRLVQGAGGIVSGGITGLGKGIVIGGIIKGGAAAAAAASESELLGPIGWIGGGLATVGGMAVGAYSGKVLSDAYRQQSQWAQSQLDRCRANCRQY